MKRVLRIVSLVLCIFILSLPLYAGGSKESAAPKAEVKPIKLVGGTMLPEGHVFWQTIVFFGQTKEYYKGPLEVDLHIQALSVQRRMPSSL
jgi:hypothetical protein